MKLQKYDKVFKYLLMILAVFISAIIFNVLLKPSKIVLGGVPGLALINYYQNGINPSITIIILTIIMLIFSYIFLGSDKTKGTILASILYPLFVYLTRNFGNFINFDLSDMIVVSILIGVLTGIANGLLYKTGFSNGGLPTISLILFRYYKIPVGISNFIINGLIIILGGFIFGTTMIAYSLIANFINSMIVDKIILGISNNKAIYILTDKKEEVKKFLMEDMKHSATIFDVKGAFLHKKKEMILTVIPTREYFQITESIKLIDPNVFYVVNNAYEVEGAK